MPLQSRVDREKSLNETKIEYVEHLLEERLKLFLATIGNKDLQEKRRILTNSLLDMEYSEEPQKTFTIDASSLPKNHFHPTFMGHQVFSSYYEGGRRRTNKHKKQLNKSRRH